MWQVRFTVKNMLIMFVFVVAAVLVAKAVGNKVPAIGQFTDRI